MQQIAVSVLGVQRIAWRTDSCAECKGPAGEDLSGGYYEAGGSYLKFSFPTAFTLTQLAWGVVQYREGYAKVQHTATSAAITISALGMGFDQEHVTLKIFLACTVCYLSWRPA